MFFKERRIQCYDMRGLKEREWTLEGMSKYIKLLGGPPGKEALLLGLKNGQVIKIFINNPFPIEIWKIQGSVQGIDLSMNGSKLAIIDQSDVLTVYNLKTKEVIFRVKH